MKLQINGGYALGKIGGSHNATKGQKFVQNVKIRTEIVKLVSGVREPEGAIRTQTTVQSALIRKWGGLR